MGPRGATAVMRHGVCGDCLPTCCSSLSRWSSTRKAYKLCNDNQYLMPCSLSKTA